MLDVFLDRRKKLLAFHGAGAKDIESIVVMFHDRNKKAQRSMVLEQRRLEHVFGV
jgi:hypothetical protein